MVRQCGISVTRCSGLAHILCPFSSCPGEDAAGSEARKHTQTIEAASKPGKRIDRVDLKREKVVVVVVVVVVTRLCYLLLPDNQFANFSTRTCLCVTRLIASRSLPLPRPSLDLHHRFLAVDRLDPRMFGFTDRCPRSRYLLMEDVQVDPVDRSSV